MKTDFLKNIMLSIFTFQLFISFDAHCMLKNIKGTYEVLQDEYKHFSLVHGAAAWETGIIRRLYDFGNIFPIYGQNAQELEIITGYELPHKTHKTVRLIHTLFYRVPGSTGESDFGPTKQLFREDPLEIARIIAQILALCSLIQANDQTFKDAVTGLAKGLDQAWQAKAQVLITSPLMKDPDSKKISNLHATFVRACEQNLDLPKANITRNQKTHYLATIKTFIAHLNSINKNFTQLLKSTARLGADMGQLVLDCLRECALDNVEALYPAHTTQMVLLAFVYKKCGDNRSNFKAFYETLNKQLNQSVLKVGEWTSFDMTGLSDTWVNDSFDLVDQQTALNNLQAIFKEGEQNIIDNIDAVLYYSQLIRSLPKLVGYGYTTYEYAPGQKTKAFPDCMDNTIRNLIDMLCYDAENNYFDLALLKKRLNIQHLDPKLEEFYTTFNNVNDSQSSEAHSAWIKVISNIPYAAYIKASGMLDAENEPISAKKWGYISIPTDDQKNKKLMIFIETLYETLLVNNYGYELMPSVRNIIVVLNHLLNLNLFENDLSSKFYQNDAQNVLFTRKYFPIVCKKLMATQSYQSLSLHDTENDDQTNFDKVDFSDEKIFSTLVFQQEQRLLKFSCEIMTRNQKHGELYVMSDFSQEEKLLIELFKNNIAATKNQSYKLLMTNILCQQSIDFSHLTDYIQQDDFLSIFTIPIEGPEFINRIIEALKPSIKKGISLHARLNLRDFLLHRTRNASETTRLVKSIIELLINNEEIALVKKDALDFIKSKDSNVQCLGYAIFNALADMGHEAIFEEADEMGLQAYKSNDSNLQELGLTIFTTLIERRHKAIFKKAASIALQASESDDSDIQYAALMLYIALIRQGYLPIFQEAAKVASLSFQSNDSGIQYAALSIYALLVTQGYAPIFEEAIQRATAATMAKDSISLQEYGWDIFFALLKRHYGIVHAIGPMIAAFASDNDKPALVYLKTMFNKENFTLGIEAVADAAHSQDPNLRVNGLQVLLILVEKNYTGIFNLALDRAAQALVFNDKKVNDVSVALFQMLLKKKYDFEPENLNRALQTIFNVTKSKTPRRRVNGLRMVLFLVKNNFKNIFNAALDAAARALESSNQKIGNLGVTLLQTILKKPYDFDEKTLDRALDVIDNATKSQDFLIKINGFRMMLFLVEQNHDYSFDIALSLARQALVSRNQEIRLLSRSILNALLEKKHIFNQEAIISFQKLLQSEDVDESTKQYLHDIVESHK